MLQNAKQAHDSDSSHESHLVKNSDPHTPSTSPAHKIGANKVTIRANDVAIRAKEVAVAKQPTRQTDRQTTVTVLVLGAGELESEQFRTCMRVHNNTCM